MSESKALVNRGDDPYPNDVKAEAVALVYVSGSYSEAAKTMANRYPDRPPSRQLITRWFKQIDPDGAIALNTERAEAFESSIIEMAEKASRLMFDALDTMKPSQIPIPAGIAMDKGLRLLERKKGGGGQLNVQFNLVTKE